MHMRHRKILISLRVTLDEPDERRSLDAYATQIYFDKLAYMYSLTGHCFPFQYKIFNLDIVNTENAL